jgi:hypothetical protein
MRWSSSAAASFSYASSAATLCLAEKRISGAAGDATRLLSVYGSRAPVARLLSLSRRGDADRSWLEQATEVTGSPPGDARPLRYPPFNRPLNLNEGIAPPVWNSDGKGQTLSLPDPHRPRATMECGLRLIPLRTQSRYLPQRR